jgi:glutamine cyclotransferase
VIAVIEPSSAEVVAWLDLSALRRDELTTARELNGIAYDSSADALWVTGKGWGALYSLDVDWLRARLNNIPIP